MSTFSGLALYYDLIHGQKDYAGEAAYIHRLFQAYQPSTKAVLDLGCGTGSHDFFLAGKGYDVYGIDLSEAMIRSARQKLAQQKKQPGQLHFSAGNILHTRLNRVFDGVVSLFYAMCYFTTEQEMCMALRTVHAHLKPGGIFVFDSWYGPAVLEQKPKVSRKEFMNEEVIVTKIAEPRLVTKEHCVWVDYTLLIKCKKDNRMEKMWESHKVRYWFTGDIQKLLEREGFELLSCEEWLTGKEVGQHTWGVVFVTRKK